MDFVKMHGADNDFVVVDGMTGGVDLGAERVRAMTDRHAGIGADGVIVVRPGSDGADGFMDYINADGSLAQMCGNGVRVVAKFLVDRGYADGTRPVTIDTRGGRKAVDVVTEGGLVVRATVDMGEPILNPDLVPVAGTGVTEFVSDYPVDTPWGPVRLAFVSMGNPHAIWFIDDLADVPALLGGPAGSIADLDIDRIGAHLESHPMFPEKANIEFAHARAGEIDVRVFERGVGETMACGTGACAVAVAAHLTGRTGRRLGINLPGGRLDINVTEGGTVLMTGPAATVYEGTWNA